MGKMTAKQRAMWERSRDLNAELREAIGDKNRWARKTEFTALADGTVRRCVTRRDGTIEKDEIVPEGRSSIIAARAGTGLSQSQFAHMMGVSVRTLQGWEQGTREPSGAAQTLLKIAAKHPRVVREAAGV